MSGVAGWAATPLPGARAFLIAGQSNALGQAPLWPPNSGPLPGVLVIRRDGRFYSSAEPIGGAGYGFGRAFSVRYLEQHPELPELWLLQAAVSGTHIGLWRPGQAPYDVARVMLHEAQAVGLQIGGVLWHQGEANAISAAAASGYQLALALLVGSLRGDTEDPSLIFVAGELGRFLSATTHPARASVVSQTKAAMSLDLRCGFVDSLGLTDKGDKLHFDHTSQDALGIRYAEELAVLETVSKFSSLSANPGR